MSTNPARSSFHYDPFSLEAMRDPQRFYSTLRDEFPSYFIAEYDAYAITRFADVWAAFMDTANFSEAEGQLFSRDQMLVHHRGSPPVPSLDPVAMFPALDPPVHSHLRRVMAPPFAKSSINRLEGDITKLVRDRLNELRRLGQFDLNGDLGSYISSGSTALVVGIPLDEAPRVTQLVNRMVARSPDEPGESKDGAAARLELMDFLKHIVGARRAGVGPESALIDSLIAADAVGRPLTDDEIAGDLVAILFGGTETVPKVLAGGLLELWKRPDQLAAVRDNLSANITPAYEEMLRFCAPAQWFGRTAKSRCEVAGVTVEPGQRVILLIAAANRDPREFESPDEFIWNRKARRLLSFGVGPHFCIGIHLARLEGQIMLRELLSTIAEFSIEPEAGDWASSEFQVGWTKLPIRFG